jgi:hypothetical protein
MRDEEGSEVKPLVGREYAGDYESSFTHLSMETRGKDIPVLSLSYILRCKLWTFCKAIYPLDIIGCRY